MEYEISQVHFGESEQMLLQLVDLQNTVYAGKHVFEPEGFKKWYLDNPMGEVVSFNAFYGEQMVAHYACVPYKMKIGDRVALGLLDIATVTHPEHRGKGLFKRLAQTTYDYAREHGYEFVLGVANANSFPGYAKYFPFTFVGQLDVKIGFGLNIQPIPDKLYSVFWDVESFKWRSSCSDKGYSAHGSSLLARYNGFVQAFMGRFSEDLLRSGGVTDHHWGWRPRLYVGYGAKTPGLYMKVSKFIKRSPFNLIFLDLTNGNLPTITKDNIFFQLFDFDVI